MLLVTSREIFLKKKKFFLGRRESFREKGQFQREKRLQREIF